MDVRAINEKNAVNTKENKEDMGGLEGGRRKGEMI